MKDIKVGIMMGSDSDLKIMSEAAAVLERMDIGYEMHIISAHRTPDKAVLYSRAARGQGLKIIIAGAGGAAHLPGVVAALTSLPVIGVPIKTPALNGVDSLYSIVQMPSGIPVATVGINSAQNAGLLAARILGIYDDEIAVKLEAYIKELESGVLRKDDRLNQIGYEAYLGNQ